LQILAQHDGVTQLLFEPRNTHRGFALFFFSYSMIMNILTEQSYGSRSTHPWCVTELDDHLAPPQCNADTRPGYGVVDLEWEVTPFEGGESILVNGTLQDSIAAAVALNPDFKMPQKRSNTVRGLAKRGRIVCGNFPSASTRRVEEGVQYLHSVDGRPRNGPGPGNCGRVSCS
jgi:hypothetical protein